MGKKSTRFVIHSKEAEKKDASLKKTILLTVVISAVIMPLVTEGVLTTVLQYTDGDITLSFIDTVLRYIVVVLRYASLFTSYAAVAVGLVSFGYHGFKAPVLILLSGSVVYYFIASYGSWIFCYKNGLIAAVSDEAEDIVEAGFNYFFLTVYSLIKNTALSVICCIFLHRQKKKKETPRIPDESFAEKCAGVKDLIRQSLDVHGVYFSLSLFAAVFELLFSATVQFFTYTLFQILADGLPENALDLWALSSGYILILPGCIIGFFVMVFVCLKLSLKKSAYKG